MNVSDKLKSPLRLALPILLAVGVIWWLYRDVRLEEISLLLGQMHLPIFALSLILGLSANIVRGYRWHLLVVPIANEVGYTAKVSNAIATVLGSYSVNMLIPRGGELWRCVAYRKYERLSLSALIGTLIADRLADVLCLGLILGCVVLAYPSFFLAHLFSVTNCSTLLGKLYSSPWTYTFIAFALGLFIAVIYIYRYYPQHRLSKFLRNVWHGICSVRSIHHPFRFTLCSLLIWLGYFGFFYTTFFAFDFTASLPLSTGLIAFAMSSLSVLAPIQNGIGAWHFMVIITFVSYGVNEAEAKSFALIVHTLQSLWIALIGVIAIVLLPIINRHYTPRHIVRSNI